MATIVKKNKMNAKKRLLIYQHQSKNVWKPYEVPKLRHIVTALRIFKMYCIKLKKTEQQQIKLEY